MGFCLHFWHKYRSVSLSTKTSSHFVSVRVRLSLSLNFPPHFFPLSSSLLRPRHCAAQRRWKPPPRHAGGPPCVRGTRCLARPAGASVAAALGASLPPAPPEAETPQPSGVRSLESHCSQVPGCDVPTSLCLSFPVCATGQRQKLLGSRIPPGLTGV